VEPPLDPPGGRLLSPNHQLDLAHRQAERFGRHLGHDGAGSGAQILRAHFDQHGPVRVDVVRAVHAWPAPFHALTAMPRPRFMVPFCDPRGFHSFFHSLISAAFSSW